MTLKKALTFAAVGAVLTAAVAHSGWIWQNGGWRWVPPGSPPQLVAEGEFAKPRSGENELIVYSADIKVWSVSCQNNGGNVMHGVPGSVPVFAQTTELLCLASSPGVECQVASKKKNTVTASANIELPDSLIPSDDDPCDDRGTPGQDKFTMVPNSLVVDEFIGHVSAFRCRQGDTCDSTPESTSSLTCKRNGADPTQGFDYDCD